MRRSARLPPRYGSRGHAGGADVGVRRVAPTFGKALHLTWSHKAGGRIGVESGAERLTAHMLTLDPRVRRFDTQPFTVDLIDGRLLRTPDEVKAARSKHRDRAGNRFYTPDFGVEWYDDPRSAVEVKLEGHEGAGDYAIAQDILKAYGYRFQRVVIPGNPRHPLHSNVPLVRQAAMRTSLWPSSALLQRIQLVFDGGPLPLGEACPALGISHNLVPVLLASGAIAADLHAQHIYAAMPLQRGDGDLGHLMLIEKVLR